MNMWVESLGIIAAVLDLSMSLPQTLKIWRNKNAEGVSLFTWVTLYTTFAAWAIYGWQNQIAATLGFIIAAALVGILLLPTIFRAKKHSWFITILTIAGIPIILIPLILYAPAIIVTIFLLSLTFNRIPQVMKSYKTYKNTKYSNVSLFSWSLGLAANLFWLIYGVFRADINLILIPLMPILYDSAILTFQLIGNRKYKDSQKENPSA